MSRFKTAIITSAINVFEWYDYALFGLFAQIIGDNFFPSDDKSASLINAFLVFAIGYVIRPVGGVIFGIIGDKFGRKIVLISSIVCMSIPTFIIGILPSYQSIGFSSTVIIVIVRLLQGLAIGGALTGSISFIIEHSPEKYKGFASSLTMSGVCVGILLGSLVAYATKWQLSEVEFNNWGWRIPFLLAILFMFMGFYIRKYAIETPEFNENKLRNRLEQSPLRTIFKEYKYTILISILLNASGSVLFYFQVMYIKNYLKDTRLFDASSIDTLIDATYLLMAFAAVFGGWCSDRLGRKRIFAILLVTITILAVPMMKYFVSGTISQVIFAHILLSIIAAIYIGAEPALQCALYPSNIRNTALSLAYNLSTSIFGGTTPYLMAIMVGNTSSLDFAAAYLLVWAVFGLIALSYAKIWQQNKA